MRGVKKYLIGMFCLTVIFISLMFGISAKAVQSEDVTYDNYTTIKVGETITITNMTDLGLTEGWLFKQWLLSNDNVVLELENPEYVGGYVYNSVRAYEPECLVHVTGVKEGKVVITCWTGNSSPDIIESVLGIPGAGTSDYIIKTENYVINVIGEKKVLFNANGGNCSTTTKKVWKGDKVGNLPTPTRSGYKFLGWYTSANGGTKVSESTVVNSDVTYYARWKQEVFKITFNANGGKVSKSNCNIKINTAIGSLPVPTRKGYHFKGWYSAKTGGTKITTKTTFTAGKTIYARWSKIKVGKSKIIKTTATMKQITFKLKRVSGVDGYEIKFSTKSNMKNAVTIIIQDTSFTVRELKRGGKYYIKVRPYIIDSANQKVYGKYSAKKTVQTAKVGFEKEVITIIKGQKKTLKLSGAKKNIKWSSDNKKIVTVNKKGKINAKNNGTAVITAKYNNKKYKCTIVVEAPKLSVTSMKLNVNETKHVMVVGTTLPITYKSSNTSVATVDSHGHVTGVSKGTATITVNVNGKKYTCSVVVEENKDDDTNNEDKDDKTTKQYTSLDGRFSVDMGEAEVIFNGKRYSGLTATYGWLSSANLESFIVKGIGSEEGFDGYIRINEPAGCLYSGVSCDRKRYMNWVDRKYGGASFVVGGFGYYYINDEGSLEWFNPVISTKSDAASSYYGTIDVTFETVQEGLALVRFRVVFLQELYSYGRNHEIEGFMAVPYNQATYNTCMLCYGDGKCSGCHGRGYYLGTGGSTCMSCNGLRICIKCDGKGIIPIG